MKKKEYVFYLGKKVGEKQLDSFVNDFYLIYFENKNELKYIFDFSDVEWVANQELLVLTGIFKSLIDSQAQFRIHFLKGGSSESITERKAKQFVQLWDVWKIYQIVPNYDYDKYFDIDGKFINRLREIYKIDSGNKEIYENYGVTPFVTLDKIEQYDDRRVGEMLSNIYRLENATQAILEEHDCILPFRNKTLSSIITKELYENFLDHFKKNTFNTGQDQAFMSLVLRPKFNENVLGAEKVQYLLKTNFQDESLSELKPFYADPHNKSKFLNRSLLQLSFVDFGEGIPNTLYDSFQKSDKKGYSNGYEMRHLHTQILEYAFRYDSSQHPILDRYKRDFAVPRGLFDLISIIKRYQGLIIVRSNFGKIAFNFSNGESIPESIIYFGDEKLFFPGVLYSIYIPERIESQQIDRSSIKPYESLNKYFFKQDELQYLSLFELQQEQKNKEVIKDNFYNELFDSLVEKLNADEESLVFIDFTGYEIDERVAKKVIFYLCTDYRVNLRNNVIVINPPSKAFLEGIKAELVALDEVDKAFKIHPIPFLYNNDDGIEVFWLGIFSENDINKLNNLLLEEHDLRRSDFENPEAIIGHINQFDSYGNLISVINSENLHFYYKSQALKVEEKEVKKIIEGCFKSEEGAIYLCNGNYYQYEYIQLFDALSDVDLRSYLSRILFVRLKEFCGDLSSIKLVGITSSSHKILDFFVTQPEIDPKNVIRLNSYSSFESEDIFKHEISFGNSVILICDVVSTGFMVDRFEKQLANIGATLEHIGAIVNAIDYTYKPFENNYEPLTLKLISIYNKSFKKLTRQDISDELQGGSLKVIRINPFTNTPITQSIEESNYSSSVLLGNDEFINLINDDQIRVGYFNFNNLIHPYFFDMDAILTDTVVSKNMLSSVFNKLDSIQPLQLVDLLLYPKESSIKKIDVNFLKDTIFKSHKISFFELERFSTNEGWRFPHPPQFLIDNCNGKNILILDDGSCSGESILQMIDEVAFSNVNSIVVLSLVSRVNDHKREFFSRIKNILSGEKEIPIRIIFGSNWHIPTYYLSKSPVMEENKWLDLALTLPNTPVSIKDIVKSIKKEITPRKLDAKNSAYLLKTKQGRNIFKELVLVRDEFGKISEYRFYKEYFDFFDKFISYHESKKSKDRGKFPYYQIETVCAVFLHEPYLYEKVKIIIPDIIEQIETFVRVFVIEQFIPEELLCYSWSKKNMIHLMFIIFKDDALFKILTPEILIRLLNIAFENESTLNYLFYKLLSYFPLEESEIKIKKYDNIIKELLEQSKTGNNLLDKQIKKFYNFLKTLPSRSDLNSQLIFLKQIYDKEKAPELHDSKVSFNHNISLILSQIREAVGLVTSNSIIPQKLSDSIVKSWFDLLIFINPILSFSITFKEFLAPYPYFKLLNITENDANSLRSLVGINQELIFQIDESFNDLEKLRLIERNIKLIQTNFTLNTDFHELIDNRYTDLQDFLSEFERGLQQLEVKINSNIQEFESTKKFNLPLSYSKSLVIKEILTNLKNHCKKEADSLIEFYVIDKGDQTIEIQISNPIADVSYPNSNGEGTKCLNLLSNSELFGFEFQTKIVKENFQQVLKLKLL